MPEKLRTAHEEILSGAPIAAILKKHGFEIKKDIFFIGELSNIPQKMHNLMHTDKKYLASIAYRLSAQAEEQAYEYCIIAEVYSPFFLTIGELEYILRSHVINKIPETKIEDIFDQMRALFIFSSGSKLFDS